MYIHCRYIATSNVVDPFGYNRYTSFNSVSLAGEQNLNPVQNSMDSVSNCGEFDGRKSYINHASRLCALAKPPVGNVSTQFIPPVKMC